MAKLYKEQEDLSDPKYRQRHQHEFGRRLLTTLIDERAANNHPRPFASIPKSLDPNDGFQDISYRQFADAIDRCAWWIKSQISLSHDSEPLMYLGAFDLRYHVLAMAAVKTGHVMFFVSPRNNLDAQLSLIDGAKVKKVLISASPANEAVVAPLLENRSLQKFVVPEVTELFNNESKVEPFIFNGTFEEYRMKPWIILHSSGSTRNPTMIVIRHGYPTTYDAYWHSPNGSEIFLNMGQKRNLLPFPPSHMAGIIGAAALIFVDATIILPPMAPLSAQLVNDIHLNARVDVTNLPPFLIMELIKDEEYFNNIKKLSSLTYGGGDLPQEAGDKINPFVPVGSRFGSTEMSCPALVQRPQEDWKYFQFDQDYSGIQFEKIENSELHELVIVRDPTISLGQAIFITFPDVDKYRSKDLFLPHPTKPGLWKYEGRLDDVIVLSNAEKVNPLGMEGTITSAPGVTGALIVGAKRFQTALLVETNNPPKTQVEKQEALNSVWPFVEMANQQCASFARISFGLIGFTRPHKPFARAGKGTVLRHRSVMMYSQEIKDLYASYEKLNSSPSMLTSTDLAKTETTESFLQDWLAKHTRLGSVEPEQDLFASGMDSLDVINLVRQLSHGSHNISTKQVYGNPTIRSLAISLKSSSGEQTNDDEMDAEDLREMLRLYHVYKLQSLSGQAQASCSDNNGLAHAKCVTLTGSTGSLGPYILDELLNEPTVGKVVCLNRSADAASRQQALHSSRGLTSDFSKVVFVKTDLAAPQLGLDNDEYRRLAETSTHIIHNAWAVNFNRHVTSFEPLIKGVTRLLEFTRACLPRQVEFCFMSSVSTADRRRNPSKTLLQVKEASIDDWSLAKLGYGQSKVVAEAIISDAARHQGINGSICRLCQVGGPVLRGILGEWNQNEWIPSLIASSKAMKLLPDTLGPMEMVDWIPIDLVARVCKELLFTTNPDRNRSNAQIWHVVNPHPTSWSALVPSMLAQLPSNVKTIEFTQWVEQIERQFDRDMQAEASTKHSRVPSTKLLTLFTDLRDKVVGDAAHMSLSPVFQTQNTVAHSETLAKIGPVNADWVELWMKQWAV